MMAPVPSSPPSGSLTFLTPISTSAFTLFTVRLPSLPRLSIRDLEEWLEPSSLSKRESSPDPAGVTGDFPRASGDFEEERIFTCVVTGMFAGVPLPLSFGELTGGLLELDRSNEAFGGCATIASAFTWR